jgi:hypothetical protein
MATISLYLLKAADPLPTQLQPSVPNVQKLTGLFLN